MPEFLQYAVLIGFALFGLLVIYTVVNGIVNGGMVGPYGQEDDL